jgi:hypothetical protein
LFLQRPQQQQAGQGASFTICRGGAAEFLRCFAPLYRVIWPRACHAGDELIEFSAVRVSRNGLSRALAAFTRKPHPSPVLHQFRSWRPHYRSPRTSRSPNPKSDQIGGSTDIAPMPTPVSLAPEPHNEVTMLQQLGGRQRRVPRHPKRPADCALHAPVPGICKRRPLCARLCHVHRIPASTAHFWGLFLFPRDACI